MNVEIVIEVATVLSIAGEKGMKTGLVPGLVTIVLAATTTIEADQTQGTGIEGGLMAGDRDLRIVNIVMKGEVVPGHGTVDILGMFETNGNLEKY